MCHFVTYNKISIHASSFHLILIYSCSGLQQVVQMEINTQSYIWHNFKRSIKPFKATCDGGALPMDDDDDGDDANDGDNNDGTLVLSPSTIVSWLIFINVLYPALLTGEIRH